MPRPHSSARSAVMVAAMFRAVADVRVRRTMGPRDGPAACSRVTTRWLLEAARFSLRRSDSDCCRGASDLERPAPDVSAPHRATAVVGPAPRTARRSSFAPSAEASMERSHGCPLAASPASRLRYVWRRTKNGATGNHRQRTDRNDRSPMLNGRRARHGRCLDNRFTVF